MLHTLVRRGPDQPGPRLRRRRRERPGRRRPTSPPSTPRSVSGLPAGPDQGLARELATAERAAAYGRLGVSTQACGSVSVWAMNDAQPPHRQPRPPGRGDVHPAGDRHRGRGIIGRGGHGRWHSRVRGLPETAGELPSSTLADEMLTPGDGQVRGLLTIAGNPVLSTPAGHRLDGALGDLEFMVSVDHYLNETTRHADVVLPPTSALERDHYDLAFHALAVRNTTRFTPAVLPKPDGPRHDWEIFRDLARGLGARSGRSLPLKRRLVTAARLRLSPTRLVDLLLAHRPHQAVAAGAATQPGRRRSRTSPALPAGPAADPRRPPPRRPRPRDGRPGQGPSCARRPAT